MTSIGEDLRLFDADPYRDAARLLRERFLIQPFSVLEATSGHWQKRKRNWLSLGIESEVGREEFLTYGSKGSTSDAAKKIADPGTTSVFDPVLCELVYRWWSPADGLVLDPFAGGSVRGIVATMMGRRYDGIELRAEQVEANGVQAERLAGLYPGEPPRWSIGDAEKELDSREDGVYDLVFSCPPYGDLEVYSDDPADLSNMTAPAFVSKYGRIVRKALAKLRPDRFAIFVVGNYRDRRTSLLRDLSGVTIRAFESAGAGYYSEVILGTVPASAGLRASGNFPKGRKPVRTHQTVLVFVKGDWKAANAAAEPFLAREDP